MGWFTKTIEWRYCEDCRFFRSDGNSEEFAKCANPKVSAGNLVARNAEPDTFCSTRRKYSCGRRAKYFEPRES